MSKHTESELGQFLYDYAHTYPETQHLVDEYERLRETIGQMERALRGMQPECNCGMPDGLCFGNCDKGLQMNALAAAESVLRAAIAKAEGGVP